MAYLRTTYFLYLLNKNSARKHCCVKSTKDNHFQTEVQRWQVDLFDQFVNNSNEKNSLAPFSRALVLSPFHHPKHPSSNRCNFISCY